MVHIFCRPNFRIPENKKTGNSPGLFILNGLFFYRVFLEHRNSANGSRFLKLGYIRLMPLIVLLSFLFRLQISLRRIFFQIGNGIGNFVFGNIIGQPAAKDFRSQSVFCPPVSFLLFVLQFFLVLLNLFKLGFRIKTESFQMRLLLFRQAAVVLGRSEITIRELLF